MVITEEFNHQFAVAAGLSPGEEMTMMKVVSLVVLVFGFSLNALAVGDPNNGAMIAKACAGCHGADGYAKQPMHPNLAGQNEKYLIWQLSAFRDGSRPSHIMNEVAKGFADQDIEDLAAYYQALGTCK